MWINYNGRFFPAMAVPVAAGEPSWQYGASLFETMRFTSGNVPLLKYHLQRLKAGAELLNGPLPPEWTENWLLAEIQKTVKKNDLVGDARIRLQIGLRAADGIPEKKYPFSYKIEANACNKLYYNDLGINIGIDSESISPLPLPLAHFKTGNYLPYWLAFQQARKRGLTDVLMRNAAGRIGEASTANVFWVHNGQLYTPPLTEPIVAGVARSRLLEVLLSRNEPVQEMPLTLETLWEAETLFLTNAFHGLRWVARCEHHLYAQGMTESLFQAAFGVMTS
jgi:branched-chain amino acid aminotransferase